MQQQVVGVFWWSGCREGADVVFVVDSSSEVDHPSFESVKSFLADLVLDLPVDSDQTRVGLVTYAGDVQEQFNLTRYSSRHDMGVAITGMRYYMPGGPSTDTANAIAYVHQVRLLNSN